MNIRHRTWQVLALLLSTLAMERRLFFAGLALLGVAYVLGMAYIWAT
jgi:hypothetical protein